MYVPTPQTYANHKRVDPWYHYVGLGLAALNLVLAIVRLCSRSGGWAQLLVAVLIVLLFFKLRPYALRVQDRVIRLEETLRMQALLDQALRGRIAELRPGQFVALRFAADEELAARMQEALDSNLSGAEIKKRIKVWRPDTFRV
jgi:hypothetical protein